MSPLEWESSNLFTAAVSVWTLKLSLAYRISIDIIASVAIKRQHLVKVNEEKETSAVAMGDILLKQMVAMFVCQTQRNATIWSPLFGLAQKLKRGH